MKEYGINVIGEGAQIFEPVTIGFPSRENIGKTGFPGSTIGRHAVLRSGTIIYCDVIIGDNFQSGHNTLIREKTRIGDRTAIGTATVIDGNTSIGNGVSLQSMVYIPTNTTIGDSVFIGPNAVLTNDRYPPSGSLEGPVIKDGCCNRCQCYDPPRSVYRGGCIRGSRFGGDPRCPRSYDGNRHPGQDKRPSPGDAQKQEKIIELSKRE